MNFGNFWGRDENKEGRLVGLWTFSTRVAGWDTGPASVRVHTLWLCFFFLFPNKRLSVDFLESYLLLINKMKKNMSLLVVTATLAQVILT